MTTEYARKYYKEYYAKNKIKYKIHRKENYDFFKKYYQEYYQKNKEKIKNTTIQNRNKKAPQFTKINEQIFVTFD